MAVFITVEIGTFLVKGIQYTPSDTVPLAPEGKLNIQVPSRLLETLFTRHEIDYRWNPASRQVEEVVNLNRLTLLSSSPP